MFVLASYFVNTMDKLASSYGIDNKYYTHGDFNFLNGVNGSSENRYKFANVADSDRYQIKAD